MGTAQSKAGGGDTRYDALIFSLKTFAREGNSARTKADGEECLLGSEDGYEAACAVDDKKEKREATKGQGS